MAVNYIYGVLRGGINITEDVPGFRYSDAQPTSEQSRAALSLMPKDPAAAAVFIAFILGMLSCSPYWPELIRDYDRVNTYDTVVATDIRDTLDFDPIARLKAWSKDVAFSNEKYPVHPNDPELDIIFAKLASLIAAGSPTI